jgi:23S rRNA G2069 N7-methylase RlmK/C1962 C5-methylase RlmI
MSDHIEALKRELVAAREANEKAKAYAAEKWMAVEDTTAHRLYKDATDDFKLASDAMLAADKALRDAALQEFKDGIGKISDLTNPYISEGVKIKMHHRIRYKLEDVIAWAEKKAQYLFKFDEAKFKKDPPDGAPFEKYDEPYCELATKSEDFHLPAEWLEQNNVPGTKSG